MKKILILATALALTGCVVAPPGPANYGSRAAQYQGDPSQWRVVSVTPVPSGTGARVAANGGAPVEYSTAPVYAPAPVYVPPPVYTPAPVYYDPAPFHFTLGLGLGYVFGHHWRGHRHYYRRGHR